MKKYGTGKNIQTRTGVVQNRIEKIVRFEEDAPFDALGPQLLTEQNATAINAFLPRARDAWVTVPGRGRVPMDKLHVAGFFSAFVPDGPKPLSSYLIGFTDPSGYSKETEDPYAFRAEISDYDLYLIGEGNHFKSYEKFGARLRSFHGVEGVHFAVWAPNASAVSVVGNFNHWSEGAHPMARIQGSGIWGLFVPGLKAGEVYKYALRSPDGSVRVKSDPYGLQAELRPRTASVVASLDHYAWKDADWMQKRAASDPLSAPVSIYELHLGSWKRKLKDGTWGFMDYRELAHAVVDYVKSMNYTHVELLPVMEHPLDESWGYQCVNYYAPTSRFGQPEDFMYFVDHCHRNGIGVILDWVPSHFPKDEYGLNAFDGRQIYAYEHWKKGEHKEWGTLVFDFGRNEVRNFLISNALFWMDKYHVDGLRVDAVASMLYLDYSRAEGDWEPNVLGGRENLEAVAFLKRFNEVVHAQFPGVLTIAEESTAWTGVSRPTYTGGLGFSMKWNMGWMHDTLEYFAKDPVHRKYHQGMLTFSLLYAFTENFVLPISHDEVVHGKRSLLEKMPGDDWQKFANARLFLGYMFGHPGKKILFQGCDIGQRGEWNSQCSADWNLLEYAPHRQLNHFVRDLNALYRSNRAMWEVDFECPGFEWVDFSDADAGVISFLRRSRDGAEVLLFVCNMTPVPRPGYRIGVPEQGFWRELLNSDAVEYGGSGIGNLGGMNAEPAGWHNRPFSVSLNLPPLAVNVFRLER